MKTIITIAAKRAILIITLISALQTQVLMAESPSSPVSSRSTRQINSLAPVTPKEATFEDVVPAPGPKALSLSPVTPKEASFEDSEIQEISLKLLQQVAPVTPSAADFNDSAPVVDQDSVAANCPSLNIAFTIF